MCESTSDVRARDWPKAPAWAGLERAQACKNPKPGPKPELGLGQAGLGLEPGLFAYFIDNYILNNSIHPM